MRIEILKQIDRIEQDHCAGCKLIINKTANASLRFCINECDIGQRLQDLGQSLVTPTEKRIERIIQKGPSMTDKEVLFLLNKELPRYKVAEALGVDRHLAKQYFDRLESVVIV